MTPTYNRAKLLNNVFESLMRQTCDKFEWIVVDDASVDNTEQVIRNMKEKCHKFNIIYIKQEHGGKHRAVNRALEIANGEMFFIVDSDDYITDDAIENIFSWDKSITNKREYCGIAGLRISNAGKIWGGDVGFSSSYIDATSFEREKYNLLGDKAEIFYTDIMKKYPFPEFENEYFVTEAVCWDAMAADGYKVRWFNKPIYICEYLEDGLTNNGANELRGHVDNYKGYLFYIKQALNKKKMYQFVLDFSGYEKTARYLNKSIAQRARELEITRMRYLFIKMLARPVLLIVRKIKGRLKKNGVS